MRLSLPWRVAPPVHLPAKVSSERWFWHGRWRRWPWLAMSGHRPLLLLDDVMSELDGERRGAFLRLIGDDIQTVITTTNLGYFTDDLLDRAKVVGMGETC